MSKKDEVKIGDKTVKEILSRNLDRNKCPEGSFCCWSGPEEMKHFNLLVSELSDDDLLKLATNLNCTSGITNINDKVDRETIISIISENDREKFYSEYNKITGVQSDS